MEPEATIEGQVYTRLAARSLSPTHMRAAVQYVKRRASLALPEYQMQILDDALINGDLLEDMEAKYGWPARSAKAIVGVLLTSIFSPVAVPTESAEEPFDIDPEDHVATLMRTLLISIHAARFLDLLIRRKDKAASFDQITNAIWWDSIDGPPVEARNAIRVFASRIRKSLSLTRYNGRIVAVVGYGYVLQTLSDAATEDRVSFPA